jgi:hypothetical protein
LQQSKPAKKSYIFDRTAQRHALVQGLSPGPIHCLFGNNSLDEYAARGRDDVIIRAAQLRRNR